MRTLALTTHNSYEQDSIAINLEPKQFGDKGFRVPNGDGVKPTDIK